MQSLSACRETHPCHSEEYPKGTCFAARSDVEIRNLLALNLRKNARIVHFRNGLSRQPVPQGHLLRGAGWLAMTGFFDSLLYILSQGGECLVF